MLPGEAQKIDRMMELFARHYCTCNPGVFCNPGLSFLRHGYTSTHVYAYLVGCLVNLSHIPIFPVGTSKCALFWWVFV